MMTEKQRNKFYWFFKIGGVFVSCLFPVWAILDKYPVWRSVHGPLESIGVGLILSLIVIAIVFRKAVFPFINERLKLKHAPPIMVWLVLIIISYILIYICQFLTDLTKVLWMGLVGCAFGNILTFIGENYFGKKEE